MNARLSKYVVSVVLIVTLALAIAPFAGAQEDHVFIRGALLAGSSNGLAIDPDGHLVIANVWMGTITVLDVTTGQVVEVHSPVFALPDDVAFGPDGSLYFTLVAMGVGRISPDGEYSTIAMLGSPNPLAFTDDGRLFVGECYGAENSLYEVDPAGAVEPRLIFGPVPGCALNAFDFGPDGFLYGPSPFEGKILKIDVDSGEVVTALDELAYPVAVEFDSFGRLHYADQATGEVFRVDLETGVVETLASLELGLDNLVFDAQDRLYVSSSVDGFIIEVLPDGATRVVSEGGMVAPAGIAVQGNTLFVAEPQAIRTFDRETGQPGRIVRGAYGVSEVGSPLTISVYGDEVITTSWLDNTVRVLDWETGDAVAVHADFAIPVNALRFQGDLIVAELGTASIVRASGDDPAQRAVLATLVVPGGLAASDEDLWASDWATGIVWQLVADGTALPEPKPVGQGFSFPEGLAVTPDGRLIIVETGTQNLVSLDPASGEMRVIASGLAVEPPPPEGMPVPPTLWFNGVAVADDGTIYAGGRAGNVIYRYAGAQ